MNRRKLLMTASAAGVGSLLPGCFPSGPGEPGVRPVTDPLSGDVLMKDVEAYVSFGFHRSGGAGDLATSDWLAEHWRSLGYEVEQPAFEIPNADTTLARVEIDDEAFDGFAQPPMVLTPPEGITGPLVMFDGSAPQKTNGSLAVVHVPRERGQGSPSEAYRQAADQAALAGALGVLVVVTSPSGEVVAINTAREASLPIPVLFLPERYKPGIEAAIGKSPARLRIEGPGGVRQARNTVARYGSVGPWVIVSTPQSGWFTCGGERGPGIAMSRALSTWAVRQTLPCRWLFIATSGHEWNDTGAHVFHETSAPGPSETALWLHLGASFGARSYEETDAGLRALDTPNRVRSFMVSEDMMPFARRAFDGHPVIGDPMLANPDTARGEIRLVIAEGYPSSAGFWGGHALFHAPTDDANATTPEIMEPIARALARMLEEKLRTL
jgi:hypothetical protein